MRDDDELRELVRSWQPGEPPVILREWGVRHWLLRGELRVPVPVALVFTALVIVAAVVFVRRTPQPVAPMMPAGLQPVEELRLRVVSDLAQFEVGDTR